MGWRFLVLLFLFAIPACVSTTRPGTVGVERKQFLLVSAADVDHMSDLQYTDQYNKAKARGLVVTSGTDYERLKKIAVRLIRQTIVFRDDIKTWKWALTYINADIVNATCASGGKITVYSGLIQRLNLTDDEIASVLGHEISHALREHGREKVSLLTVQKLITNLAEARTKDKETQIAFANEMTRLLYTLPNTREQEKEADEMGVELAARAGYDPRAALSLWTKMSSLGSGPPEFLSDHPSNAARIADIKSLIPKVMPLYNAAPKP